MSEADYVFVSTIPVLDGVSDERKVRRFAMDVVRAMFEGKLTTGLSSSKLVNELATAWGLLDENGGFLPALLGAELDLEDVTFVPAPPALHKPEGKGKDNG